MQPEKVCRSSQDKVLCGVCGGLAEYWQVSTFWVRIAAIIALIMWFPLSILVYFVCCWLMPPSDLQGMSREYHQARRAQSGDPGSERRFRTSREAYQYVSDVFNSMEQRICKMEDKVVSKEFQLNQKFQNL